jgi:hypothetical protein
MAESFYKSLDIGKDVVSTRTLLHEAIPLTGTIVSGTYGDDNIKEYAHGMFQSVYDYPYLSSSANHIFRNLWQCNQSKVKEAKYLQSNGSSAYGLRLHRLYSEI